MSSIKFLWIAAASLVLGYALFNVVDPSGEGWIPFLAAMILLSFPSGWLMVMLIAGFLAVTSLSSSPASDLSIARLEMIVVWALLLGVGYVQWFVIVPALVRRARLRWTKPRRHDPA